MAASLLERRLHFVVGKGGVGKTTVAAALALTLARRGRRTLAVEMEPGGRLAALLGREADPRLYVLHVDGRTALEEYLSLVIPVKRLLATVFQSKVYQDLVAAANRLHRRHFDPAAVERLRVAATAPAPERALLHCVAERAAEESGWSDINAASLARLRAGIGDAPLVELPFLFVEEFARTELEQVARLLEAGMAGRAEAAARPRSRSS